MKGGIGIGLLMGVVLAAGPCGACGYEPTCLGDCAYKHLLQAEGPHAQAEAYLVLAHAWAKGRLLEGVPRLIYEILKRVPAEDSLAFHARVLLARTYYALGHRDSALLLYEQVAQAADRYPFLQARAYLGLAGAYAESEPLRAQGYAAQALEKAEKTGVQLLLALVENTLAYLAAQQGRLSEAIEAAQRAKAHLDALDKGSFSLLLDPPLEVYSAVLANLASLYAEKGDLAQAHALYEEALTRSKTTGDSVGTAHALVGLAGLYVGQKQPEKALNLLAGHQGLFSGLPYSLRRAWAQVEAQAHIQAGRLGSALKALERWALEAEKEMRLSQGSRLAELKVLSGLQAREAEVKALQEQRRRERIFYAVGALLGLVAIGGLGYAVRQARRRAQEEQAFREVIAQQAERLEEQARALERQNEELLRISEALTEALSTVQESYAAAKRLQRAILPPLERLIPGSAVYYQPMHEVGGDFYTAAVDPFSTRFFLGMGDCTGHGISGAILSGVVAATLQNLFLQNPAQPPLTLLRRALQAIRLVLQSDTSGESLPVREGADVALLIADFREKRLHVGLAGRPVWIAHPQEGLTELSGGRRGLDSFTSPEYEFPQFTLPLAEEGTVYLFSDGVTDLLNAEGKKFGVQRLRAILEAERLSSPQKQLRVLVAELEAWRGKAQPNDDLTWLALPLAGLWEYARTRLQVSA